MSEPLPLLQTDATTYERPTQAWVCGSSGPCRLGPDAKGRCRAAGECQPSRKGEAWACSRPAAAGGPCSEGALPNGACSHPVPPCRPVRSLRSRRGLAVWGASALSVGALVCLVGGSWRREAVSPGELTFKHGTVAQSCDACHTTGGGHPLTWLATALREHGGIPESRRCLNCHQMGDQPLAAHSLSAAALDDVHRRVAAGPPSTQPAFTLEVARHWPGSPQAADAELACAVCHHEHQGKDATLARMGDQQCQACHTTRFPSFGDGHPEFDGYPYHRRTALRYDHVSHLGRHYRDFQRTMPEGKAPTSCLDCHEQSPAGRMMLVRGFDKACASCHLSQIEDSSLGGIVFLNLPGLDVATLRRRPETVAVGEWPESASGDPSPFMRFLLSTDARFVKAETVLDGKVDLRDLRMANDDQLRAVDQYVWAIKGLLEDLSQDAPAALSRRLEKALGERIEGMERSSLTGDLPQHLLRRAQQQWLPDLASEMAAHRAGTPLPKEAVLPPPAEAPPLGELRSRWYANDVDFSIRYRPKGHAGDFMRAWLDRSAPGTDAPGSPGAAPLRAIFASLSDPSGPGRCTKCHSIESVGEGSKINWLGRRETPNVHAFTKFAHVPHFSLLGEKGCQTCHVLNENADVSRGFVHADNTLATDPGTFESSFASMNKAACARCHVQKAAGDSCLTCHNYHIGFHPPATPNAPFPGADHAWRQDASSGAAGP